MTRIIGGMAGSLQLASPAKSTRPTSDRVRESVFNRLSAQDHVDGAVVLDLFAGTGALGLEALSRGAKQVVLVEQNRQAAAVCQKNTDAVTRALRNQGLEPKVSLQTVDASGFARSLRERVSQGLTEPFDLVFIDPPYEFENAALETLLLNLLPALETDSLVIVERASRTQAFVTPQGFEVDLVKSYGDTSVYWLAN